MRCDGQEESGGGVEWRRGDGCEKNKVMGSNTIHIPLHFLVVARLYPLVHLLMHGGVRGLHVTDTTCHMLQTQHVTCYRHNMSHHVTDTACHTLQTQHAGLSS